MVTVVGDTLIGAMDVTVHDGKITEINILADLPGLKSLQLPA